MQVIPLENLSGFRRRLLVTPAEGRVVSELEDDYHCVCDPIDGRRRAELRRNGTTVLSWSVVEGRFVAHFTRDHASRSFAGRRTP